MGRSPERMGSGSPETGADPGAAAVALEDRAALVAGLPVFPLAGLDVGNRKGVHGGALRVFAPPVIEAGCVGAGVAPLARPSPADWTRPRALPRQSRVGAQEDGDNPSPTRKTREVCHAPKLHPLPPPGRTRARRELCVFLGSGEGPGASPSAAPSDARAACMVFRRTGERPNGAARARAAKPGQSGPGMIRRPPGSPDAPPRRSSTWRARRYQP